MPIITQLLTDSEYAVLKDLLDEDSFFDCGSPHPIRLLQRDIDMATRVNELSSVLRVRNIVGDALWKKIVDAVGGSTLYVPLEKSYYPRRNQQVRLFARDHTIGDTARHFCLSARQVKRILGT